MMMVKFMKSLQKMIHLWGNSAIVHCHHFDLDVTYLKVILLLFDQQMVIHDLYGLQKLYLILSVISIILIVY